MNTERIVMTNEYLAKCETMLENMKLACSEVRTLGYSWNKACERHGIDHLKARSILLKSLSNCTELEPLDETLLEDAYDGSWYVYRSVFGAYNLEGRSLPYDYEASVDYVLKTLDSELEDVARRHFGLKPYKELQCYREIAEAYGIKENRARKMLQDALRALRKKKTQEILLFGLSKYQTIQDNAKREYEAELAAVKAETDLMVQKRRREHERLIKKLEDRPFKEAVGMMTKEGVAKELGKISISTLNLSIRPYNLLRRNGICNMYDIIMAEAKGIKEIRGMGCKSAAEVEELCDKWVKENFYGMTPSEMKDLIEKEVLV